MEAIFAGVPTSKNKSIELFLLHLRYKEGRLLYVEGNNPLLVDDPRYVWIVYSGAVDVFAVPVLNHEVVGTRSHLFHGDVGQLLIGLDETGYGTGMALLVTGVPGTRVLQLEREKLAALAADLEYEALIAQMINEWTVGLSCTLFSSILPKDYRLLDSRPDQMIEVDETSAITPRKGVVWVEMCEGTASIAGEPHLKISDPHVLPVPPFVWLRPEGTVSLSVWDTPTALNNQLVWPALDQYHRLALTAIVHNQARERAAEHKRLLKKAESEQQIIENALLQLSSTLSEEVQFIRSLEAGHDALWAACNLVGEALGTEIIAPAASATNGLSGYELLDKIAQASRIRTREVALRGKWWQQDNGPLLGFTKENQPVALIPLSASSYEMVDPLKKTSIHVNTAVADQLTSLAYTLYRSFPDGVLTALDVVKFGLKNCRADLQRILLIGVGLGLLRLLPPIATGMIFNTYIPSANVSGLAQMGIALLVVAVTGGMLQVVQGIALLRVQSRMDASLQAALWDRLLNLPLPFFRQFTAGDLGMRVMGVTTIRRILSGYVINTLLTFVFTSFNLVLLFFYSWSLALVTLGLVLLASVVTGAAVMLDIRHQRDLSTARGALSGQVLEFLTGIAKLRITASENQAFALWTDKFVRQNKLYFRARKVTNNLVTFNSTFLLLSSLVIFTVIAVSANQAGLSVGDFLAFNLALVQFLVVWTQMSSSVSAIATTVPIYERLKPILETQPEVDEIKVAPPPLTGAIEVSHASFRYGEKSPLVLKDISINIAPGEFVAFVGASGSGKSTLLRLLLGFEHPEAGGIYYDGQDLGDLDAREVRRQLGVVLQNSALMTGDIYDNIVGASNLSLDAAWEAARLVGLAPDIESMPMGMSTVITGRGGTLSGGQRQRIMIARAIVNRPRILFFDEATSALDNQTQQIVSQSLETLQATRIVIAHRLSTIINADRIYVFHKGEIVQAGTYDELMMQAGPFAELARRQMV